jgi:riboflavin synthase
VFTGLVQDLGRVMELTRSEDGARLTVSASLTGELREGDSVSVNGVCLTSVAVNDGGFSAEVMNATLERTALAALEAGDEVNLELPLRPADRLGGHFVQGHVDGVGRVAGVTPDGFARRVELTADSDVLRYLVPKGSVAVDGVSLTVAELDDRSFTVSLIPETLERTNLGRVGPGHTVNLEVDVLAKYVDRLVNSR